MKRKWELCKNTLKLYAIFIVLYAKLCDFVSQTKCSVFSEQNELFTFEIRLKNAFL